MDKKLKKLNTLTILNALNEGVRRAAEKNAGLGYPERFLKPGDYVAPPLTKPLTYVELSVEEVLAETKKENSINKVA